MGQESNDRSDAVNPSQALPSLHYPAPGVVLQGTVLVLLQFDVCESIDLDRLRDLLPQHSAVALKANPIAPGYVRYQRPPVVEPLETLVLESGERLSGGIKYYDYGVLSVVLHSPFVGDWQDLLLLASRWVWDIDFAAQTTELVRKRLERVAPALVKPYASWLSEDYLIFQIQRASDCESVADLIDRHSSHIAKVVRGDMGPLAESEINEVMRSRISYYATDLAVIGWNAAFIYDSPSGAETAVQLLEYANSQLLEFRHYDEMLTKELETAYKLLDKESGVFARWKMARSAFRLHRVLLDVQELTEHADNAIKFLSDMFSARFYKLAASKVGVPDYKDLVTSKVHTAKELYRFMVEQFNQSRAFFLEVTVVVILVIELVYLFLGRF